MQPRTVRRAAPARRPAWRRPPRRRGGSPRPAESAETRWPRRTNARSELPEAARVDPRRLGLRSPERVGASMIPALAIRRRTGRPGSSRRSIPRGPRPQRESAALESARNPFRRHRSRGPAGGRRTLASPRASLPAAGAVPWRSALVDPGLDDPEAEHHRLDEIRRERRVVGNRTASHRLASLEVGGDLDLDQQVGMEELHSTNHGAGGELVAEHLDVRASRLSPVLDVP